MNFRTILSVAFLSFFLVGIGQQVREVAPVVIKGKIKNAKNKRIFLGTFDGKNLNAFCLDSLGADGSFFMNCNIPSKDLFYLRFDSDKQVMVVLQVNDTIEVNSDASNFVASTEIKGSLPTQNIWTFQKNYTEYQIKLDSARKYLKTHPGTEKEVNESFQPISSRWIFFRNNFIKGQANSPALIVALQSLEQNETELRLQMLEALTKTYSGTATGNMINSQYQKIKMQWESEKLTATGAEAPEIIQADAEGGQRKLSDLRGQVVLLDFWASWCGPCRKENPNVVKLYHKYKDKGFTVFSVSMDSKKDRWLDAIKKDGLVWPDHVSDLQGWRNAAGQKYGVSSIPTTFLLDKDGKIIGKNLRGYALEAKLKEIFGF